MTEQQLKGLSSQEAKQLQEKFGKNELVAEKKESIFHKILQVICEPMFLLLIIAAVIYFILGEPRNGAIMLVFVVGVISIEAIQYADIGVAMGKRGSEVSREAADLILLDDNFSTIVDTIKNGRRIYDNIRKALGYVFTIHIPIAFASLFAPLLGISPASLLLLPLHVVLLELVYDLVLYFINMYQKIENRENLYNMNKNFLKLKL